eukprot:scaffold37045_cov62-Phaeocystis_antarctica.AAC.5
MSCQLWLDRFGLRKSLGGDNEVIKSVPTGTTRASSARRTCSTMRTSCSSSRRTDSLLGSSDQEMSAALRVFLVPYISKKRCRGAGGGE